MIGVLKKIWHFAGEEQGNIRKSMILGPSKASPLPRSHTAGTGAQFYNHDQGGCPCSPLV